MTKLLDLHDNLQRALKEGEPDWRWIITHARVVNAAGEILGEAECPNPMKFAVQVTGPGTVRLEAINRDGNPLVTWDLPAHRISIGDTIAFEIEPVRAWRVRA